MKKHDYSQVIIMAALAVTVARYVGAFLASDLGRVTGWVSEFLTILMGLSGIGMGVLDVLGLAYVFDGWRKYLPKSGDKWSNRFSVLTAFVVALFVVGVGILVPFTVARISSADMSTTLGSGGEWAWALCVNLAPYLLIGGVTFSQSGFVTIRGDAVEPAHNAEPMRALSAHVCAQCGEICGSQQQLAAHTRWKHTKGVVIIAEQPAALNGNGHGKKES